MGIQGAFHDNSPGSSGFGFCRTFMRTKTKQGTEKASKHNRRTVFSRDLVFCTHQQKWRQLCFLLSFILFLTICISFHFLLVPPGVILMPSPRSWSHALSAGGYTVAITAAATASDTMGRGPFICKQLLSGRRRRNHCLEPTVVVLPNWDTFISSQSLTSSTVLPPLPLYLMLP